MLGQMLELVLDYLVCKLALLLVLVLDCSTNMLELV